MRFKKIYIEITNSCNLSCSFCIQNKRKLRQMSLEEFEHILKQIQPYTTYVYLHVLGEPLSHSHIEEIVKLCDQYSMQVNMTSNGTLLKQKELMLLSYPPRQLNISLHSFPQHHQRSYIDNCIEVGKKLANKKVYVSYRLWSMNQGVCSEEVEEMKRQVELAYSIESQEIKIGTIRLADYTFLHMEETFAWPSLQHPYVNDRGACLGMKQMCGILSDGSVVPCCLDSHGEALLGNIFDQEFKDIIEGERAKQIVQGFSSRYIHEPLCQRCSYRLRFSKEKT